MGLIRSISRWSDGELSISRPLLSRACVGCKSGSGSLRLGHEDALSLTSSAASFASSTASQKATAHHSYSLRRGHRCRSPPEGHGGAPPKRGTLHCVLHRVLRAALTIVTRGRFFKNFTDLLRPVRTCVMQKVRTPSRFPRHSLCFYESPWTYRHGGVPMTIQRWLIKYKYIILYWSEWSYYTTILLFKRSKHLFSMDHQYLPCFLGFCTWRVTNESIYRKLIYQNSIYCWIDYSCDSDRFKNRSC